MNNKITYRKEGDYLIPNLYIKNFNRSNYHIGKYGHLRLDYLKNHNKGYYTELMISGTLSEHLSYVDKEANKRVAAIIKRLAEAERIDENLKLANQLEWVKTMNNIKNRAEEIVFSELIYV